ncbi:MAG: D-alanine--D-alanine ligase [Nitrospirota bacterium]|nr:MAG: D-alanine--D-alanine ligase [Nitrospirota bacterium]
MELRNRKIALLMGGTSAEREVSLKSGAAVSRALNDLGLDHVDIDADSSMCRTLMEKKVDLAFIALHGGWGEDGAIQGMLEILDIPYTGSDVLSSALAMDKEASKIMFEGHDIKIPPYFVIRGGNVRIDESMLRDKGFEPPLFIKPATEGSSVGVTFVKEEARFSEAVSEALKYGERVIVERYIKGKEVQIGILGGKALGGVEVRPSSEFYDYSAKYEGGTQYILPPEIDESTYAKAKNIALGAHKALGCSGATRVDLIVDDKNDIYVLEVNTIPGLTETSLLPKIAGLAGYDFKGLVKEMLVDAISGGKE